MALQFYNSLTHRKEPFTPLADDTVKLYSCGPTVYNVAHIGNFRSFIFMDLLRRYLRYKGYTLKHVMNITDLDDKTIRGARREGVPLSAFTERYTRYFLEDLDTLGIERPEIIPRATETIPDIIAFISTLEEKGHTYRADGSVYFRIASQPDYGKLVTLDEEALKQNAGGRLNDDEYGKDDVRDFVLWKARTEDDGDVYWDSPFGPGRPGWHIECSVMSSTHLGAKFDIHTGGLDLKFPHHENEIAQSEGVFGDQPVVTWMHNGYLIVDGEKMSKSLGNFLTLRDLLEQGVSPAAVRFMLLGTHYRKQLNFRRDDLPSLQKTLHKLSDFYRSMSERSDTDRHKTPATEVVAAVRECRNEFDQAMDDDLNISGALAAVFELTHRINPLLTADTMTGADAAHVFSCLKSIDGVLNLCQFNRERGPAAARQVDTEWIEAKIRQRSEARQDRDFAAADKIRDELAEKGITLLDGKEGTTWKKD